MLTMNHFYDLFGNAFKKIIIFELLQGPKALKRGIRICRSGRLGSRNGW